MMITLLTPPRRALFHCSLILARGVAWRTYNSNLLKGFGAPHCPFPLTWVK